MLLDKRRGIKRTKRPAQEGDSAGPYLDVETGEPFLVEPGGVFCWSPSGWECVVLPPVSYWPGTNSDDVQVRKRGERERERDGGGEGGRFDSTWRKKKIQTLNFTIRNTLRRRLDCA